MSISDGSTCPKCGGEMPSDAAHCPHCGETKGMGIVTIPVASPPPPPVPAAPPPPPPRLEDLPPPSVSLDDLAKPPPVEPPVGPAPTPPGEMLPAIVESRQSRAVSTSFVSFTSTQGGGFRAQMDGEVKLDLPQQMVDPDRRLTSEQYRRLMDIWDDALGREMQQALRAGQQIELGQLVGHVPLPFAQAGLEGVLSPADQEAMTPRAQAAVQDILSMVARVGQEPRVGNLLVNMDVPMINRPIRVSPRQGVTVGCSLFLGLLALGGVLAAAMWWSA